MASPKKFRTHEALNLDAAAMWTQKDAKSVEDSNQTITVWKNDGSGVQYHTVHLMTSADIYFIFVAGTATSTPDLITGETANLLYLKGGDNIHSLKIPHGLAAGPGSSIALQMIRVSSNSTVRYVLA
tara:strand:- start:17 stop:397 length:381 start_codon:yes stop_codon:yes gene_type:complete